MDFGVLLENFIHSEYMKNIMSTAMQVKLTEWLMIVAIVWVMMGRRVSQHFKALEQSIRDTKTEVVEEIKKLREAVMDDLAQGEARMELIEKDLAAVKKEVMVILTLPEILTIMKNGSQVLEATTQPQQG